MPSPRGAPGKAHGATSPKRTVIKRLPFAFSIPHAGVRVPTEVTDCCLLTEEDVSSDSERGLEALCRPLMPHVEVFATTKIARSIVDLDRAGDDRSPDGVIKTHTRSGLAVYRAPLPERQVQELLERYYWPYHDQLQLRASRAQLGLDWHEFQAAGATRAHGPNGNSSRHRLPVQPQVVLRSPPEVPCSWTTALGAALARHLDATPTTIHRAVGGHIAGSAPGGIRWIRVELSEALGLAANDGAGRVHEALSEFTRYLQSLDRGKP